MGERQLGSHTLCVACVFVRINISAKVLFSVRSSAAIRPSGVRVEYSRTWCECRQFARSQLRDTIPRMRIVKSNYFNCCHFFVVDMGSNSKGEGGKGGKVGATWLLQCYIVNEVTTFAPSPHRVCLQNTSLLLRMPGGEGHK